jgi:hypothetical protein
VLPVSASRHSARRCRAEFTEIESGKRNDRPEIAAGLSHAKACAATLVIAKLDRLARNVFFVSSLMEAGVDFVACDNPHATRLTIHILAAVAENERDMISQRTTAALAVVRNAIAAKGSWVSRATGRSITRLGNPHGTDCLQRAGKGNAAALAVLDAKAVAWRRRIIPIIAAIRSSGVTRPGEIAIELTRRGVKTQRGGRWRASMVSSLLAAAATEMN